MWIEIDESHPSLEKREGWGTRHEKREGWGTRQMMSLKRWMSVAVMMLAVGCSALSLAQSAAMVLPNDPAEYLRLVAETNGITAEAGEKPWHLQVSYKVFNEDGTVKDQGRYEEYWVSQAKYKQSYTSKEFNQTIYGTEKGIMKAGDKNWPSYSPGYARAGFVNILPARMSGEREDYSAEQQVINGMSYLCILKKNKPGIQITNGIQHAVTITNESYCFDGADHLYNRSMTLNVQTVETFSHAIQFQRRAVPSDVEVRRDGKLVFTAHLESLEELKTIDEALFVPSADAELVPVKVVFTHSLPSQGGVVLKPQPSGDINVPLQVNSKEMEGLILNRVAPVYPAIAKAARVTGVIVLKILIGTDGHVEEAEVYSGPSLLHQAAIDAVKQWVFKPYLKDGVAVKVETGVKFVFELPGPVSSAPTKP